MCVYHCALPEEYTIQHRSVITIFPLIFQKIIIAQVLSTGRKGQTDNIPYINNANTEVMHRVCTESVTQCQVSCQNQRTVYFPCVCSYSAMTTWKLNCQNLSVTNCSPYKTSDTCNKKYVEEILTTFVVDVLWECFDRFATLQAAFL